VHKTSSFLLLFLVFFFGACETKTSQETQTSQKTKHTEALNPNPIQKNIILEHKLNALSDTFTLSSLSGEYYTVTVSNKKVTFKESHQGIILLSFFATWSLPCLPEIPYLNILQKQYSKDLFIAGILVHDKIKADDFKTFIKKHSIDYYLSNSPQNNKFASLVSKTLKLPKAFSIPLTVMYVGGEYFTHYEGIVPIEMIRYDIEQAQESLK